MKNCLTKKIPAVFVTVALLFITVFSMSIFANAATTFSPRLSAPSTSNSYFYSDKNLYYKYGYGMPNCTAYAYGRAYEILKTEPKLCPYDAYQWYDYNKSNGYYSYGQTPKLGAIACWSYYSYGYQSGHVAVVEKIENGTITFSNSAYSGSNFYLTYASTSASNPGQSNWNFQGYIYIGNFDNTTTTTKPQSYSTGIYKVNVDDYLNMRSGAGTGNSVVTQLNDGTSITVTKVQDGWGYTTYNGKSGWVSLEYCTYVSAIPTTQPTTVKPTTQPTTAQPTTVKPTTQPTTAQPVTTKPATEDIETYKVGDVNLDGVVDIVDASMIQRYLSGNVTLTATQIKYADFDGDGIITIDDITSMQRSFSES